MQSRRRRHRASQSTLTPREGPDQAALVTRSPHIRLLDQLGPCGKRTADRHRLCGRGTSAGTLVADRRVRCWFDRSVTTRERPAGDFDYEQHGAGYAFVRQPDPRIAARVHAALGVSRTVLDVGAGAGSYEPADRLRAGSSAVEMQPILLPPVPGISYDLGALIGRRAI